VWYDGKLVGGIVCHAIDRENSKTEIGYWLAPEYAGRGLITRACRAVIDRLFEHERLRRVEIWSAAGNRPSRAVAERLGFTLEGVLRQSDYFNNAFHDYAVYGMLAEEWQAKRAESEAVEEHRG
jgi:ribosomal-protein-serine acetyltransferase